MCCLTFCNCYLKGDSLGQFGSTIMGLFWLAVIVGVILAIRHGMGALERGVRVKAVSRGEDLKGRGLAAQVPVPASVFFDHLIAATNAQPSAATFREALFIHQRTSDQLFLGWGTSSGTSYTYRISTAPEGGGCRLFVDLVQWRQDQYSKILTGLDSMEAVRSHVGLVVSHLGGTYELKGDPDRAAFLGDAPVEQDVEIPEFPTSSRKELDESTIRRSELIVSANPTPQSGREGPATCRSCGVHIVSAARRCPRCGASKE